MAVLTMLNYSRSYFVIPLEKNWSNTAVTEFTLFHLLHTTIRIHTNYIKYFMGFIKTYSGETNNPDWTLCSLLSFSQNWKKLCSKCVIPTHSYYKQKSVQIIIFVFNRETSQICIVNVWIHMTYPRWFSGGENLLQTMKSLLKKDFMKSI